jgi:membrane protease YdiL (CAAX protease family)
MTPANESANRRAEWSAVVFALLYPTLLTVVYFILLAGSSTALQQGAFGVGKCIQFAFPAVWAVGVRREHIGWSRPRRSDLVRGGLLGLVLLAIGLASYEFVGKPAGFIDDGARDAIRQKIAGFDVATLPRYALLAAFYSLVHSLFEEYYWRWFVFGRLRHLMSLPAAIGVSSVGFMAHHVCIVATFFGWLSPMSLLLSIAVAAGGALWAWIYHRTNSLYVPWISHAFVDAAIFLVGFDLIKDFSPP